MAIWNFVECNVPDKEAPPSKIIKKDISDDIIENGDNVTNKTLDPVSKPECKNELTVSINGSSEVVEETCMANDKEANSSEKEKPETVEAMDIDTKETSTVNSEPNTSVCLELPADGSKIQTNEMKNDSNETENKGTNEIQESETTDTENKETSAAEKMETDEINNTIEVKTDICDVDNANTDVKMTETVNCEQVVNGNADEAKAIDEANEKVTTNDVELENVRIENNTAKKLEKLPASKEVDNMKDTNSKSEVQIDSTTKKDSNECESNAEKDKTQVAENSTANIDSEILNAETESKGININVNEIQQIEKEESVTNEGTIIANEQLATKKEVSTEETCENNEVLSESHKATVPDENKEETAANEKGIENIPESLEDAKTIQSDMPVAIDKVETVAEVKPSEEPLQNGKELNGKTNGTDSEPNTEMTCQENGNKSTESELQDVVKPDNGDKECELQDEVKIKKLDTNAEATAVSIEA